MIKLIRPRCPRCLSPLIIYENLSGNMYVKCTEKGYFHYFYYFLNFANYFILREFFVMPDGLFIQNNIKLMKLSIGTIEHVIDNFTYIPEKHNIEELMLLL